MMKRGLMTSVNYFTTIIVLVFGLDESEVPIWRPQTGSFEKFSFYGNMN
jgi:hypothetical protein